MKIQTQLNRIERELSKVATDVAPRNAIKPVEAFEVAKRCTEICETAAIIAGQAREVMGVKNAKKRLFKKVRTALGFVYP